MEIHVSKFSFVCQAGNTVQENVFLRETRDSSFVEEWQYYEVVTGRFAPPVRAEPAPWQHPHPARGRFLFWVLGLL